MVTIDSSPPFSSHAGSCASFEEVMPFFKMATAAMLKTVSSPSMTSDSKMVKPLGVREIDMVKK